MMEGLLLMGKLGRLRSGFTVFVLKGDSGTPWLALVGELDGLKAGANGFIFNRTSVV